MLNEVEVTHVKILSQYMTAGADERHQKPVRTVHLEQSRGPNNSTATFCASVTWCGISK